jgi:hypothetical protein
MAQTTVLTTNGRNYTASQMAGNSTVAPKWIGIGSANTPAAAITDTDLTTPYQVRVGLNNCANTANVFSVVQTIVANSIVAIGEAGVFYSLAGSGNMVLRSTFDTIGLQANDSIQVTATISYS